MGAQPSGRASIKDVALRAGVSVGTVSNVLNRPELVTPDTKERVEQAMRELRFVRNASARQLRAGQSQTVGVIIRDLSNPFYTTIVRGAEDRLAEDNLTLMLCSSDDDPKREKRYLRQFAEQGVRGVILTPTKHTESHLSILTQLGIPAVLLDSKSMAFASVGVDNVSGARQAVRHLLQRGHRRIAYLGGPRNLEQCKDRLQGAREAVEEAGLAPKSVLVPFELPQMTADAGQAAMASALDAPDAPTAVFCINDIVALGAMRELRIRNLDIPGDVAVVGYDDVLFAGELMTPLTSVRQPMRQLGWMATEMLLTGADPSEHRIFRPELIVRRSSSGEPTGV